MTAITCPQTYEVTPTELNGVAVDYSGVLRDGEICVGTPTVTMTGLTLSSPAVSTSHLRINGESVQAGKAITFIVTGGVDGTDYNIKTACSTSASRTREVYCLLKVRVPTATNP